MRYPTTGCCTNPGRRAGCVPGVLPNYWVRYRTNGCFTGVNDRVCYRTTGLVAGVLPGDRADYRRIAERQGATGVLPDDRACYRTTGCVTGGPGVLPVCCDVRCVVCDV